MGRMTFVMIINVLIPGAGLVVLRREWLGLATSVLFALLAIIFISSRWIIPSDIPSWAAYLSLIGLILVWVGSMVAVVQRARFVRDPEVIAEIKQLQQQGASAIEGGDLAEARRVLLVAINLDDEDAETWAIWSKLMEGQDNTRAAHVGWKRVLRLADRQELQIEARQRLGEG